MSFFSEHLSKIQLIPQCETAARVFKMEITLVGSVITFFVLLVLLQRKIEESLQKPLKLTTNYYIKVDYRV